MNKLIRMVAALGLALTIVPGLLIHFGNVSIDVNKQLMLAGTIIWFFSAPLLMKKNSSRM